MKKFCSNLFIFLITLFCFLSKVYAAEILQVTSSSILLIGDNNRTYTVKIACTEIRPNLEEKSFDWLKEKLPRHTKVNLRPKGSENGILIAKVIPFNSNIDIADQYVDEGFAIKNC
tara:strand:+ start:319 stop:666 length:348 start_codon:yes stop_codon:yes gene_type:complete